MLSECHEHPITAEHIPDPMIAASVVEAKTIQPLALFAVLLRCAIECSACISELIGLEDTCDQANSMIAKIRFC